MEVASNEPDTNGLVTLDDIRAAADRIAPFVDQTPVVRVWPSDVVLKVESLHAAGAFKIRGALNSMLQLDDAQRACGVVAHSSGNHAIAVADAARRLGIRAVIVMPADAPAVKRERTQRLGADVILVGSASSERMAVAAELARERGLVPVEPYDSAAVIAATGTISLELLAQAPDVAEIYVPISGGGLAAGVATGAKAIAPHVRVVGVEPEVAADALESWRRGEVVALTAAQMARTIADGLRVQQVGTLPWAHLRAYVDDIVTVSETEIREAMRTVALGARLVAEPSGATPVAAALAGPGSTVEPSRRAAILCGGNVDPELLAAVLAGPDHREH